MNPGEANAPDLALQLDHVGLLRGEKWILRDISWRVPTGSCVAVLGPNGSGKSTLARVLLGYLWATRGSVRVEGRLFGETNLAELRRTVRLLQPAGPFDLDGALTARQVVQTGRDGALGVSGVPLTSKEREHVAELVDLVGISKRAEGRYAELSTGEKVRTLTARALFAKPRVLILDEPTSGLDLRAREQLLSVIDRLVSRHADRPTLVVITHHLEELPRSTSDVLLLSEGSVAARGSLDEVIDDALLSAVYGCSVRVAKSDGKFHASIAAGGAWDVLGG